MSFARLGAVAPCRPAGFGGRRFAFPPYAVSQDHGRWPWTKIVGTQGGGEPSVRSAIPARVRIVKRKPAGRQTLRAGLSLGVADTAAIGVEWRGQPRGRPD